MTDLKPRRCRALRKASSGRVPDLLVRRITRGVAEDDAGLAVAAAGAVLVESSPEGPGEGVGKAADED